MRPEWENLRQETTAAQAVFLDTEADTGITLARIALKASDPEKISRNLASARKAYETVSARLAALPSNAPGLEGIREKMATLEHMLHLLKKRR
jgi:DNA-binding FadR family transcriptional regulator